MNKNDLMVLMSVGLFLGFSTVCCMESSLEKGALGNINSRRLSTAEITPPALIVAGVFSDRKVVRDVIGSAAENAIDREIDSLLKDFDIETESSVEQKTVIELRHDSQSPHMDFKTDFDEIDEAIEEYARAVDVLASFDSDLLLSCVYTMAIEFLDAQRFFLSKNMVDHEARCHLKNKLKKVRKLCWRLLELRAESNLNNPAAFKAANDMYEFLNDLYNNTVDTF